MRICIVGDFSDNLDEGYKNTSYYLARGLEQHHTVVRLNSKRVGSARFWRSFAQAKPQIIHTIAQPTDESLILTRLLQMYWPQARTVISALRADSYFRNGKIGLKQRLLLWAARPNLMLVQNTTTEALFRQLDCAVVQLSNGVDLERFKPVCAERKRELRLKYGLDLHHPVVLHVGHLHRARNLPALQPLVSKQIQVVVAGSLYMGTDNDFIRSLEQKGFHILKGYQPHVEELYMLADCYVFPTPPGASLTMPLSVLEAMACNLPVITTRFAGLEQAFAPGHGFHFVDHADDIPASVENAFHRANDCTTRTMVQPLSWQAVIERLHTHYEALLRSSQDEGLVGI